MKGQLHIKENWPLLLAFAIPVFFLIYLSFASQMDISCDAASYDTIAKLIKEKGWVEFFKEGPQREPLYPSTIVLSLSFASLLGYSYLKIQTFFQIGIIFLSMGMIYAVLQKLNIRRNVIALSVFYFGVSPAIVNSALSLYSEVITYPLMLGIVWVSLNMQESLKDNKVRSALLHSVSLGSLLTAMTMVKGAFELVVPIFMVGFMVFSWKNLKKRSGAWRVLYFCSFGISLLLWAGMLWGYKSLNQQYNGNFLLTDRGPRHFYGNMVMRTEPLTQSRLKAALTSIPGEGVCQSLSTKADCAFWNFQQCDAFGFDALNKFAQGDNVETANKKIFFLGMKGIGVNPWQYGFLTAVEAVKMFFWESTRIGFVTYPGWLAALYENTLIKNGLRLFIALVTIVSFVWAIVQFQRRSVGMTMVLSLVIIFIIIHSLGSVLTRYSFPIVPFYICLMAYWLDNTLFNQRQSRR